MQAERISARQRGLSVLPWLILALGLSITAMVWQNARRDAAQALHAEFAFWVDKVAGAIDYRLSENVQVLRGVVGLFNASATVARQEFHRYVAALRLEERYPGMQGLGFSLLIPSAEKTAHEAAIRQEGFPDYAIRPSGEREFYTSVVYLEPFTGRNLRAFGYDMTSEPVRWAAAVGARDSGQITLSGKVILRQETATEIQPGFLIFAPIYQDQPSTTVQERRAHLRGWAFSPVRMHDLMQGVLRGADFQAMRSMLDVRIYDGVDLTPETQLFALHPDTAPRTGALFQAVRQLSFGGRLWSLQVLSASPFEARLSSAEAQLIAVIGGIGSLLLALLIRVLTTSQRRVAIALAEAERSIVERQQAEAALRESETKFRLAFDHANTGMCLVSLQGRLLQVNARMSAMFGYEQAELEQMNVSDLSVPEDQAISATFIQNAIEQHGDNAIFEKRYRHRDGHILHGLIASSLLRDVQGQPLYFISQVQDITDYKRLEAELREQALRDPLTGLFNRRYLDETLPRELNRAQHQGEPLSVAMLDLDHFKRFNDCYGHEAGDVALRAVGTLLQRSLRAGDITCRYGGEELTLILPGAALDDAQQRLEALRQAIMELHMVCQEHELPAITVSIGLTAARPDETDPAAVLGRADAALYRAKQQGRNCIFCGA